MIIEPAKHFQFKHISIYFSRGVKIKAADKPDIYLSQVLKEPISKIKTFLNCQELIKKDVDNVVNIFEIVRKFSSKECDILKYPKVFNLKPSTVENRANILQECGFHIVNPKHILLFLTLIKKNTIANLKKSQLILEDVNVQGRLVTCLSEWPTYPAMIERKDDISVTLYATRMRVLSRYLELKIDLPIDEFENKILLYPRIKHRPLKFLDKLLHIFQAQLRISNKKIKSHFHMLEADPQNVENILSHIPYIAGMDIRDAIRKRFIIFNSNYKSIIKIEELLEEHGICKEVQKRCMDIFCMNYKTVEQRLIEIQNSEEYKHFIHHPRYLKLVFNKNTADQRLHLLKDLNKVCRSLNVLSGSSKHFQIYANSQGDKTQGRDITKIISSLLNSQYTSKQIHKALSKHPFFIKIPPQNLQVVFNIIKDKFTTSEIFASCQILLYPSELVLEYLEVLLRLKESSSNHSIDRSILKRACGFSFDNIDFNKVSNGSILNLTVYILEKKFHFSGNAVWGLAL